MLQAAACSRSCMQLPKQCAFNLFVKVAVESHKLRRLSGNNSWYNSICNVLKFDVLQIFCEVAYVAKTSDHLLDGIDEFIDDLTVLPPSIWDPTTRMEPPQKTISMVGLHQHIQWNCSCIDWWTLIIYSLFHDLLRLSILHHYVWSEITGHNSLQRQR